MVHYCFLLAMLKGGGADALAIFADYCQGELEKFLNASFIALIPKKVKGKIHFAYLWFGSFTSYLPVV